jgi:hypothetical protein
MLHALLSADGSVEWVFWEFEWQLKVLRINLTPEDPFRGTAT